MFEISPVRHRRLSPHAGQRSALLNFTAAAPAAVGAMVPIDWTSDTTIALGGPDAVEVCLQSSLSTSVGDDTSDQRSALLSPDCTPVKPPIGPSPVCWRPRRSSGRRSAHATPPASTRPAFRQRPARASSPTPCAVSTPSTAFESVPCIRIPMPSHGLLHGRTWALLSCPAR
jgi:hypothetical protein